MLSNLSNMFLALGAVTAVTASPAKRQTDAVTCDYVFSPAVAVDPSATNLVGEFNFIIGRSLSTTTGGDIFNFGSTVVDNADDTFNVENKISATGQTAAQTATILTGLAGSTIAGPTGIDWVVESVVCA